MMRWWKNRGQAQWNVQAARLDALSVRERAFLFLSVIACCLALADVLWLTPARAAHAQLTQRFQKQDAELQRARAELSSLAKPVDSSQVVRDEIETVNARLEGVNQGIKAALPTRAETTPLAQALVQLLRRHEGLTLVRTSAVAPQATAAVDAAGAAKAAGVGTAVVPVGLTRQGVELTVSGAYPDLTRYVQALEKALPQVRWGTMNLKGDTQPPELTLQLFLIGLQS